MTLCLCSRGNMGIGGNMVTSGCFGLQLPQCLTTDYADFRLWEQKSKISGGYRFTHKCVALNPEILFYSH